MPINPVQKYFSEYIEEELSATEMIRFHKLLPQDPGHADRLDKFYQTHIILKQYQRPDPDKTLIKEFHTNLEKNSYFPTGEQKILVNQLSLIIKNLIYTKSLWVRAIETFALVLVGIFLGWILFYGGDETQVGEDWFGDYYASPITIDDYNYIYYYFQASEMVLYEMHNMNDAQSKEGHDIYLNKEIATKLLKKTFLVHDKALQLNDIRMLRFIGKMEFIMYELSNLQEGELDEALEMVRMVIRDEDLLEEAKRLQMVIDKVRSSAG